MKKWIKRLNPRDVAWYAMLELTGAIMYSVAAVFAYYKRGYFAIGGEVIAFLFPVVYYFVDKIIWALWDTWREARNDGED